MGVGRNGRRCNIQQGISFRGKKLLKKNFVDLNFQRRKLLQKKKVKVSALKVQSNQIEVNRNQATA